MLFTALAIASPVAYVLSGYFTTSKNEYDVPSSNAVDSLWRQVLALITDVVGFRMKTWNSHMAAPSETQLLSHVGIKVERKWRTEVRSGASNAFCRI